MVYNSTITFTLDTICPWTYLAKSRLSHALDQFRDSHKDTSINYTLRYAPYQLYPEVSKEGEDKYNWYKNSRYDGSEDKMSKYMVVMSAYGRNEGINFKFGGKVANTLDAHRLIQHYQEEKGPEIADKIVSCKSVTPVILGLDLPLREKKKLTKQSVVQSIL
jgi:predicted DsbA family dithiol-disulfide isomerase